MKDKYGVEFDESGKVLIKCPTSLEGTYRIPNSVVRIGQSAFEDCKLTSVVIPDSVQVIAQQAFMGCWKMESIVIPKSVKEINLFAFAATSIEKIFIPESVTKIDDGALSCIAYFEEINVDNRNPYYCSIDGVLFSKDKTKLIQYPDCKKGTTYTIPPTVNRISGYAFNSIENLKTIYLQPGMTSKTAIMDGLEGIFKGEIVELLPPQEKKVKTPILSNDDKSDVFISYAHEDKNIAEAICHTLESHSIKCWIAPRDVTPGIPYARAIIQAIKDCRLMVLVYSKYANQSEHVANEIDRMFNQGKTIIPFVTDTSSMNEEYEYYLSRKHWLVAYPEYKDKCEELAQVVQRILR